jgi:hypothetical protein
MGGRSVGDYLTPCPLSPSSRLRTCLRGEGVLRRRLHDVFEAYGAFVGAGAEEDDALDAVGCRNLCQNAGGGEEKAAARAPDLRFDLGGGEVVVDEGGGGAGEDGGVVGNDPVDAVFGADGGAVAGLQSEVD